jgi:hypothetical protein
MAPARRRRSPPKLAPALRPPRTLRRDLYLVWRSPRIGQGNPHRLTNPVWTWLARASELSAYQANARFQGPSSMEVGPAWCAMRFGQSRTELPDGRVLRIAGEHEDHYDPDFFIYNDVIVESPGGEIAIYGYPYDVFGPTDFHSATPVGDEIVVMGNLGYPARRRAGVTPVVRLDTRSMAMRPVTTEGMPPGWIHRHTATLTPGGDAIVVSGGEVSVELDGEQHLVKNPDDWALDVRTFRWTRLTERRWEQWELRRADDRGNELWRRDMAYRYGEKHGKFDEFLFKGLGDPQAVLANRPVHEARYSPPVPHEKLPDDDTVPLVLRRVVDGVTVRYVEESHAVEIVFEGTLPAATVDLVVDDACAKLGTLEGVAYLKRRMT